MARIRLVGLPLDFWRLPLDIDAAVRICVVQWLGDRMNRGARRKQ
jgi:hypothetical protein